MISGAKREIIKKLLNEKVPIREISKLMGVSKWVVEKAKKNAKGTISFKYKIYKALTNENGTFSIERISLYTGASERYVKYILYDLRRRGLITGKKSFRVKNRKLLNSLYFEYKNAKRL